MPLKITSETSTSKLLGYPLYIKPSIGLLQTIGIKSDKKNEQPSTLLEPLKYASRM